MDNCPEEGSGELWLRAGPAQPAWALAFLLLVSWRPHTQLSELQRAGDVFPVNVILLCFQKENHVRFLSSK